MRASPRPPKYPGRTIGGRAEANRVEKLLASEYHAFFDAILVESPFAETTRNGRGIRQVALALTSSRLIVAADVFRNNTGFVCPRGVDSSIESFELVSVYPLEYVSLSVFRRRRQKTLKARFIDGRTSYYELAGMQRRTICWEAWCEQVELLLAKRMDGSSLSETTAASSSSSSTLYLVSSEIQVKKSARNKGNRTVCRVWAHYGGAGDYIPPTWPAKDTYLGPSHAELTNGLYTPVPIRFAGASIQDVRDELKDYSRNVKKPCHSWPKCQDFETSTGRKTKNSDGLCDVLFFKDYNHRCCNRSNFISCQTSPCEHCPLDFRRSGTVESQLCWFNEVLKDPKTDQDCESRKKISLGKKISRFGFGVPEKCSSGLVLGPCRGDRDGLSQERNPNPCALLESGVAIWEGKGRECSRRRRHLRRYGLCTAAHFLHALGPWLIQPGERVSFQGRRSFSLATVRRQPADVELRLPVSRRQLGSSVSCTALEPQSFAPVRTTRGRVILFWTPDYWYRPRTATSVYRELRRHLDSLQNFRQEKDRQSGHRLFSRRKTSSCFTRDDGDRVDKKPSGLFGRIFSGSVRPRKKNERDERSNATGELKRFLKMDFRITVWDLDSGTLAAQLTLIDRDLFARITADEIRILVFQKTPRNAVNLGAWIAFSHRISCLTASEILAVRKIGMRARIIARLINVANKCFLMGNFHSCRSIVAGLQAPAIYRLRDSWAYLRNRHASRYETLEKLCKIYRSPWTSVYRKAWVIAERHPPCLPYVGDLLTRILILTEPKRPRRFVNDSPLKFNLPVGNRPINSKSNVVQDNLQPKQSFGRRILAVMAKITFRTNRKVPREEEDLSRQEDLERKYFYRWFNILLKSKLRATEEERSRNMDPRRKLVLDVASWLTGCQRFAQAYDFPRHSFAREFLLKARYKEDRENFFISLKLEPPSVT